MVASVCSGEVLQRGGEPSAAARSTVRAGPERLDVETTAVGPVPQTGRDVVRTGDHDAGQCRCLAGAGGEQDQAVPRADRVCGRERDRAGGRRLRVHLEGRDGVSLRSTVPLTARMRRYRRRGERMGVARWGRGGASLLIVAPRLDRSRSPRRRVEESSTVVRAVGPRPGQTAGMGRGREFPRDRGFLAVPVVCTPMEVRNSIGRSDRGAAGARRIPRYLGNCTTLTGRSPTLLDQRAVLAGHAPWRLPATRPRDRARSGRDGPRAGDPTGPSGRAGLHR